MRSQCTTRAKWAWLSWKISLTLTRRVISLMRTGAKRLDRSFLCTQRKLTCDQTGNVQRSRPRLKCAVHLPPHPAPNRTSASQPHNQYRQLEVQSSRYARGRCRGPKWKVQRPEMEGARGLNTWGRRDARNPAPRTRLNLVSLMLNPVYKPTPSTLNHP